MASNFKFKKGATSIISGIKPWWRIVRVLRLCVGSESQFDVLCFKKEELKFKIYNRNSDYPPGRSARDYDPILTEPES